MDNQHTALGDDADSDYAPWIPIASRAISAVEHPCVVKNVDEGIASLGGAVKLSKGLRSKLETTTNADGEHELKKLISASLRPHDPFARQLLSTPVRTNNLLLKVTVPRRTGRRRKRGTDAPFLLPEDKTVSTDKGLSNATHSFVDASNIYRSLQDNASTYKVAIAGVIDETHRFRNMPDLQYAASQDESMLRLKDQVLSKRYNQLKEYTPNTAPGANLAKSIGPSAEFLQMPLAFNYRFQQNTYVKYTEKGVVNLQRGVAYNAYSIIKATVEEVPTGPKSFLPPENTLTPYLQTLIKQIRAELDERPIITRHILYNKLGWDKRTKLRQAAVYCGYFFESGPWREALVRWGLDPRKDAQYRKYQTVSFLSYSKTGASKDHNQFVQQSTNLSKTTPEALVNEHTFDGVHVSQTGNLFQFCDITDPLIARVLSTKDIRTSCAPTFQGWYHVGTWAKATVLLKDKMNTIIRNEVPDDNLYQRIVQWPELWDDKTLADTYRAEINDREVRREKRREHEVMQNVRLAARNPRYAFEKMESVEQQPQQGDTEDGAEEIEVPEDMAEDPVTVARLREEDGGGAAEMIGDENYDGEDDYDDDNNGDDEVDGQGEDMDDDDEDDGNDSPGPSVHPIPDDPAHPAPFGGIYRF